MLRLLGLVRALPGHPGDTAGRERVFLAVPVAIAIAHRASLAECSASCDPPTSSSSSKSER